MSLATKTEKRQGEAVGFDFDALAVIGLAVLIGVLGGLFAILFRLMIDVAHYGFHALGKTIFGFLKYPLWMIFVPALAGLLVGPLTHFLAREAKGHGVPEVMEAVALRGGFIRMRVIFVKAIASASSIGAGASVGREGPIVQMGSGIGSVLARWCKQSEDRIKTSVGCGAAAGISATFNAPLAGVIFAQEVILGRFNASTFIPIVVSSVTASFMARIFIGNTPAFSVPSYGLNHPLELLLYVLLGVLAALAAVVFVKTLYKIEDYFNMWKSVPAYLKPVFGGLLIGAMGLYYPQILGVGYETIEAAFNSEYSAYTLASVVLVKILATSITLGSGHSGGVFAPSLVIGATLGGSFGLFAQRMVPQIVAYPGAYAIAGMGAVVAGTTQAPITAVLIIFEMTRDYSIMLPLMTAVVFSTLIYSRLSRGSIYTIKLLRRGVNLEDGKDINLMKQILIKDIMTTPVVTVNDNEQLGNVIEKMHNTKHNSFPVLNSQGDLAGIIALQDIREMPVQGIMDVPVKNAMSTRLVTVQPEDSVDKAFRLLRKHDIGHLPVVAVENPRCLVGIITRSDLIKAYERHSLGR